MRLIIVKHVVVDDPLAIWKVAGYNTEGRVCKRVEVEIDNPAPDDIDRAHEAVVHDPEVMSFRIVHP